MTNTVTGPPNCCYYYLHHSQSCQNKKLVAMVRSFHLVISLIKLVCKRMKYLYATPNKRQQREVPNKFTASDNKSTFSNVEWVSLFFFFFFFGKEENFG